MPVSIDITQDIRFQDGLKTGIKAASLAYEATLKAKLQKDYWCGVMTSLLCRK